MTFGQRFNLYRKKAGYTQIEVAEQLSVTPQAVSKWETDTAYPDITLIVAIAALFDVSTDDLLGYTKKSPEEICSELHSIRYYEKSSQREKYDRCLEMLSNAPHDPNILIELLERICTMLSTETDPDIISALLSDGERFAARLRDKTELPTRSIYSACYLFNLYYAAGELDRAQEIADTVPAVPRYSGNRLHAMLDQKRNLTDEAILGFQNSVKSSLLWVMWDINTLAELFYKKDKTRERSERVWQCAYDIIRAVFGDECDYPYPFEMYYQKAVIRVAQSAAFREDREATLKYLDEYMAVTRARIRYAKEGTVSPSPLIASSAPPSVPRYDPSEASAELKARLSWHAFDFIREDEKFKNYLAEAERWEELPSD